MGNAQVVCFCAQMGHDADMRPVAVVLGAAVWPGGTPSPSLRRRARHAAQLWQGGQVRAIIASGGIGQHPPSEAEAIAEVCKADGVPEEVLFLEDMSTSTEENILFSSHMLGAIGGGPVVLVTDGYHAPRALLVARRFGLEAKADCPDIQGAPRRRALKARLREIPAFVWYWLRVNRRL